MPEDFWGPVFARLQDDIDFVNLLLKDTSDADLVSWIKPNPGLMARCAVFLKKGKIADRKGLEKEFLKYAQSSQPLRKVILLTWVEKNPLPMSIPTLKWNEENQTRILNGEFGKPEKMHILARLDPRSGVEQFYQSLLASLNKNEETAHDQSLPTVFSKPDEALIKAEGRVKELEAALEDLKNENRKNKKLAEAHGVEIAGQSRRLEEQARQIKNLLEIEKLLKQEVFSLQLKLQNPEKISSIVSQVDLSGKDSSQDAEIKIESLQKEVIALQKAVKNRESSIARLETEKLELQEQLHTETGKDKRITNLQKMLSENAALKAGIRHVGQIIAKVKNENGKNCWLFLSLTGKNFLVKHELFTRAKIVYEELCLLSLDENGKPFNLESLESENRQEMFGLVKVTEEEFELQTDSENFPIKIKLAPELAGLPVRAFWLPELLQRESGIYFVEGLQTMQTNDSPQLSATLKQIKEFFKAETLNLTEFCRELRNQGIEFTCPNSQSLLFAQDYGEILNSLRMRIKVSTFCKLSACKAEAETAIFARACNSGESCEICGKFLDDEVQPEKIFAGQRVIIFGGDRVGSEYEKAFARHNLKVVWHSGFKKMNELKAGLGNVDLVVVITRQVSHTLLREIAGHCEKSNIPIIFCHHRGISGVLLELQNRLT